MSTLFLQKDQLRYCFKSPEKSVLFIIKAVSLAESANACRGIGKKMTITDNILAIGIDISRGCMYNNYDNIIILLRRAREIAEGEESAEALPLYR